MVLNTPAVPFHNKENVVHTHSPVLCSANGRRSRSRTKNTPSPVLVTSEAACDPARCRTSSPASGARRRVVKVADGEMARTPSPTDASAAHHQTALPRILHRPPFREVLPAALAAVDPDLNGIPMEYILHSLQRVGQEMLSVVKSTTVVDLPRNRLPRELEVVINDISADVPTHLFAVHSRFASRFTIHPAHALVLAAQCALLPALPHSKPLAPTSAGAALTLPIIRLRLPSPETFPILMHYLYTKRADHLLALLIPMSLLNASQPLDPLAGSMDVEVTVSTQPLPSNSALLSHAATVEGLWRNVVALGVFDTKLWRVIEYAWEAIVTALATSTGATWRTMHEHP